MTATEPKTHSEGVYASLRAELLGGTFLPGSKLRLAGLGNPLWREPFGCPGGHDPPGGRGLGAGAAATRLLRDPAVRGRPAGSDPCPGADRNLRAPGVHRPRRPRMGIRRDRAHHTLQGTPYTTREGHLGGDWSVAHHAFHRALLTGANSPRLESIATELRDCSLLYQHWSIEIAHDLDRDVAAEHRNIAELAVARDAEGAVQGPDGTHRTDHRRPAGVCRIANGSRAGRRHLRVTGTSGDRAPGRVG